ncbi:diacylglycerol diphosphate phosphatase / phosphatidate phosphatase [Nematocida major]|uniref:diacylglycerol diphosphate phosphatase / phosphatidate phosphatase n=1 Tax=Nematocida major TaxID=1912982 RepID=UPI002008C696|nr:diacylglycerol diphosphate phosphatase / phosphatidate phosphatase [Nematocida major]KAH9386554.1 diacylglycerol diphosphate phosphatase / phosphatidate phosphatase [Nematocida major]
MRKHQIVKMLSKALVILILLGAGLIFSILSPLSVITMKSVTPGLSYKENDTVEFYCVLLAIVFLLPPMQILISGLANQSVMAVDTFQNTYIGCLATFLVIGVIKCIVGKERPDYADRIQRTTGQKYLEGRRSFPSGHAGMSFAFVFYLVFDSVLAIKRSKSVGVRSVLVYMGIIVPFASGIIVAASRISDHRHDIVDVLAGAGLGVVIPLICRLSLSSGKRKKQEKAQNMPLAEACSAQDSTSV